MTENAPLPTQTTLTITGAGSASFSIAYESTGIYQYKVTQNTSALTAGNGHYDTTVYYVKVYVIELEDGSIGTEVKVYKGSASGDKCDELVFANTYDSVPGGGSSGGGSSKTTDGTVSSTEAVTAQTGDNAHIALYALVMIVALAGILFLVISIRRKKTE
ncbi:MAG: LPXTG cell wall anchor domain-containing protein [Lachnospiraceae bacterium]|nr:LPXTG cell wall anchor domain-containing protein [Lachnospiraceae bacterium]